MLDLWIGARVSAGARTLSEAVSPTMIIAYRILEVKQNSLRAKSIIARPSLILTTFGGDQMPNRKQTSPKVASKASKQLSSPRSTKGEKSVAASALAQTRKGKK